MGVSVYLYGMLTIHDYQLHRLLDFPSLMEALREGFRSDITVPLRHQHPFGDHSMLILMPAWQEKGYLGVKLLTVNPLNQGSGLPSIQGLYLLFNAETGQPIAQIDAPVLTNYRTAAASALAAGFLARQNARTFLMVGTGSLAPYLVRAHCTGRHFDRVGIWGRNQDKADRLAKELKDEVENLVVETDLSSAVKNAEVISVATLSEFPLIRGQWLQPGTHLDLVGSYRPAMREADDLVITRSTVFIDTVHGLQESGDLVQPIQNGILEETSLGGTLYDLCRGEKRGRTSEEQITLFKSVGHASEDLMAAVLAYEKYGSVFY